MRQARSTQGPTVPRALSPEIGGRALARVPRHQPFVAPPSRRKWISTTAPCLAFAAAVCLALMAWTVSAGSAPNWCGKWALHYAGPHDVENNTCDLAVTSCGGVVVNAPAGPGYFDIYVLAMDVVEVKSTRFGLYGDGQFYFYQSGSSEYEDAWRTCGDMQIRTHGWPGCGEGVAVTWTDPQIGSSFVIGVFSVYAYGMGAIWTGPDPSAGIAQWCDGTMPEPRCDQFEGNSYTGCYPWGVISFGGYGIPCCPTPHYDSDGCLTPGFDLDLYGHCSASIAAAKTSWGAIKAMYKNK
jgi:hypothetical protein